MSLSNTAIGGNIKLLKERAIARKRLLKLKIPISKMNRFELQSFLDKTHYDFMKIVESKKQDVGK